VKRLGLLFASVVMAAGMFAGVARTVHADGPSACVHLFVDVNGTQQTVDQCAP